MGRLGLGWLIARLTNQINSVELDMPRSSDVFARLWDVFGNISQLDEDEQRDKKKYAPTDDRLFETGQRNASRRRELAKDRSGDYMPTFHPHRR